MRPSAGDVAGNVCFAFNRKELTMQVKDPVCGMTIESDKAAGQAKHQGKTYYFCSTQCQQKFESAPQRYLQSAGPTGGRSGGQSKR
jgi:YHS domain-containing protein